MSCSLQCPKPLAIKKREQSFLCNCVRESDEKIKEKTRAPEEDMKGCSPSTSCTTPDCGAKQSFSQFDTNSKKLCFPVSLVENPFTQPWPLFTGATWSLGAIETWRTRNPLYKYASSALSFSLPFKMQNSGRITFWFSYFSKFLSDNSIRKMS